MFLGSPATEQAATSLCCWFSERTCSELCDACCDKKERCVERFVGLPFDVA